jgi:hypothetical protein
MQHPQTEETPLLTQRKVIRVEVWYNLLVAITTQGKFEKSVAIDWSGDKEPYLRKRNDTSW